MKVIINNILPPKGFKCINLFGILFCRRQLNEIDIKIDNTGSKDIILLNGENVSKEIRTKEVTSIVSQISSIIPVREKMVEIQRKLATGKNVSESEGRTSCKTIIRCC